LNVGDDRLTLRQIWQIFVSENLILLATVIEYLRSTLQEMVLYLAFGLDYYHPLLGGDIPPP
jgi:hypothetical protein